jgi:hypothetical protein
MPPVLIADSKLEGKSGPNITVQKDSSRKDVLRSLLDYIAMCGTVERCAKVSS